MYSSLNQILDGKESECKQAFVARHDEHAKQRKWEKNDHPYKNKVWILWDKPVRKKSKG